MVNWQDDSTDSDLDIGDLQHIVESLETEIRYAEEMVDALPGPTSAIAPRSNRRTSSAMRLSSSRFATRSFARRRVEA